MTATLLNNPDICECFPGTELKKIMPILVSRWPQTQYMSNLIDRYPSYSRWVFVIKVEPEKVYLSLVLSSITSPVMWTGSFAI